MKVTESQVNRYVQKWFRRLMLSDLWTISVKINNGVEDEAEENRDAEAHVTITDGYDHADLVVNAFRIPEGGLELAIVHELTHLALRELEMLAEAGAGKEMSPVVRASVERAAERLSRAMAPRK